MNYSKNLWKIITNIVLPALSLFVSFWALANAIDARDISRESNAISQNSNSIAKEANKTAKSSITQALEANKIALDSNSISKNSNKLTERALEESATKAHKANILAKRSADISEKSLLLSKEALSKATKYAEINAQVMWNTLREAYDRADRDVFEWEQNNAFQRAELSIKTKKALTNYLKKIKISDRGMQLYLNRFDKRMSLIRVSEVYEPFRERLATIDFTLPKPPRLPVYLLDQRGRRILDQRGNPIRMR